MDVELKTLRGMVRNAKPGSVLLLAPDVYDKLVTGSLSHVTKSIIDPPPAGYGLQVRRVASMKPGTAIVTVEGQGQDKGWTQHFLSKSGPAPAAPLATMTTHVVHIVVEPPPEPAPPASPTLELEPARNMPPRPRQRIVDT